jgi:hypothetical protein
MKTIKHSEIKKLVQGFDLFVCSSSFENRCLGIAKNIMLEQFKNIVICHFENNYDEVETHLKQLESLFDDKFTVIELSKNNPLANYDKLFDEINKPAYLNVLLDISTFTREMFLVIFSLFKQPAFLNKKLTLCYNPSDQYSSTWLSKGVDNIRSVLGFSGDFSPIKKLLLIVLVGFEAERSQILIDNFEPNLLFIGKAPKNESTNDSIAQINENNFQKLLKTNSNAKEFAFSCKELPLTQEAIRDIAQQYRNEYNIVISPMSNKLSTLAVASVAFEYPEVQICYASPNLYNIKNYSTPSEYIYKIDANELW